METQVTATPVKTDAEFYQELIAALDALPVRELIRSDLLRREDGRMCYCAVGAMVLKAGTDIDPPHHANFGVIAKTLKCSSMHVVNAVFANDNYMRRDLPVHSERQWRWVYMREWAEQQLALCYAGGAAS